jgi:hypothetical protein
MLALLQHGTRALYEEPSQIWIATLADTGQTLFAAG